MPCVRLVFGYCLCSPRKLLFLLRVNGTPRKLKTSSQWYHFIGNAFLGQLLWGDFSSCFFLLVLYGVC